MSSSTGCRGWTPTTGRRSRALSAEIRRAVEGIAIPDDLASAITRSVVRLGGQAAYAVRSSATAEDLPTASFAGQQDTYLNVVGSAEILAHVSRCLASLFTERAVIYRLRNGFDHRKVQMAVVVQQMVFPQAAGLLFTADPVTSNRKVVSIEASFGLGEALVAGLVNADVYQVRGDDVIAKTVAAKRLAIHARPDGGTEQRAIGPEAGAAGADRCADRSARSARPADRSALRPPPGHRMVPGRRRVPDRPEPADHHAVPRSPPTGDQENHVYISVGHQQMMTDAMRPLGLSVWQLTTPRPMAEVAGRLFVDVTQALGSPAGRAGLLQAMGRHDPLIAGRVADRHRPRRLHRVPPGRGPGRDAGRRRARPDRDRSGHRHRTHRAQPGVHRRVEARHRDEVRVGAARLHPG